MAKYTRCNSMCLDVSAVLCGLTSDKSSALCFAVPLPTMGAFKYTMEELEILHLKNCTCTMYMYSKDMYHYT